MPLNSEQLDCVKEWIEERSPVLSCSGCGGRDWSIQNELAFALLINAEDGQINHRKGYPMVAVTCKNCGYTAFFNAIQMGIMPQAKKQ
jgi:predicted nucleic-acid-binding Zn-ribbon protein